MATYARVDVANAVAALKALPREFSSKNGGPVREALYAAARPIRDVAEFSAPIRSGNLQANVYIYRDRDPRASTGAAERYLIGVRQKRRGLGRSRMNMALGRLGRNFRTRGDAYYWWCVEFGTAKMQAQPFLRPAFEWGRSRIVPTFSRELGRRVDAAVRRASRARA